MANTYSKNIHFLRILRIFFMAGGILFTAMVVIAFTTLPFRALHWLGTSKSELGGIPKTIVLLGGSGMPSESNLIRSWYVAKAAHGFPEAKIVIAMPGDSADSHSTPQMMKAELALRGINPHRMMYENKGTNTRAQALHCINLLNREEPLLLVTSPDHMRRAVLCFQKAGFSRVYALPAFENATEANLTIKDMELGGRKNIAPGVSNSISARYQVWNHLKYEITFARELVALQYYRLRGWI